MEVTYTPPTDPALLDPATLSQQLLAIIDQAVSRLSLLSDEEASLPYAPGKWSTKQVIGHLIDSAINNLARIVRLQSGPVELPSYAADAWVACGNYQQREWKSLQELWTGLNRQFAWIVVHTPQNRLTNPGTIEGTAVTLGFVIEDYIAHMRHHLASLHR